MAFIAIVLSAACADATDQKIRVLVPGITCASTAMAATDAARSIPGVLSVDDDMISGTLTITFDGTKTDIEKVTEGMKKADYPVEGKPEFLK
jgi:mercuric ion binding protein